MFGNKKCMEIFLRRLSEKLQISACIFDAYTHTHIFVVYILHVCMHQEDKKYLLMLMWDFNFWLPWESLTKPSFSLCVYSGHQPFPVNVPTST